jgi:hypothetical protein
VLLGIVYSLLISVKATGLLLIILTLPLLAPHFIRIHKRKLIFDLKPSLVRLGYILLPMTFGLFWYIKDLFLYQSPLYPFGLKLAGLTIFPGKTFQDFISTAFTNFSVMPTNPTARLWFVWTEQKDWFGCLYNYDATFSGLGPIWFIVLLPTIPLSVYLAIKKKNSLFLALASILLITLAVYPANYYARYTIFIVALGIIAYGLIADVLWRPVKIMVSLILIWLAYNVVATTFTLCNFPPKLVREQLNAIRSGAPRDGQAYANTVGPSYLFLQKRIQPNETVAYDSKPYYIYPLWRQDFSNKVIYVNGDNKDDWLSKIKKENVRYIFLNKNSQEHKWAERSGLTSIYKDVFNEIYKAY